MQPPKVVLAELSVNPTKASGSANMPQQENAEILEFLFRSVSPTLISMNKCQLLKFRGGFYDAIYAAFDDDTGDEEAVDHPKLRERFLMRELVSTIVASNLHAPPTKKLHVDAAAAPTRCVPNDKVEKLCAEADPLAITEADLAAVAATKPHLKLRPQGLLKRKFSYTPPGTIATTSKTKNVLKVARFIPRISPLTSTSRTGAALRAGLSAHPKPGEKSNPNQVLQKCNKLAKTTSVRVGSFNAYIPIRTACNAPPQGVSPARFFYTPTKVQSSSGTRILNSSAIGARLPSIDTPRTVAPIAAQRIPGPTVLLTPRKSVGTRK